MKPLYLTLLLLMPFISHSANNSMYIKKIQESLDKQPPLCLGTTVWPVHVATQDISYGYINAKMEALTDAELTHSKIIGKQKTWQLTSLGLKEFNKYGDLCYGKMVVEHIERIYQNKKSGSVIFDYSISSLPSWARHPSVRFAYTDVDNLISGIKTARYQANFKKIPAGKIEIVGEPYQLDLLY
ncbi:CpmK protein [Rouxiella sp. S1S-2]|uniref:CpmK protein n=1 Tax=Rouxiella sp. S1S-2 TaxID=2653856 RepID=UPI0012640EFB|nr:CpmK protein [Rouxiella sp. S1S-2]KAB7894850.1 CpmK protein [Rouxiella sp. S1S-2]